MDWRIDLGKYETSSKYLTEPAEHAELFRLFSEHSVDSVRD